MNERKRVNMDPYIINNMPEDEPLTVDLELVADDIKVILAHDGGSYVLLMGSVDSHDGAVVAAFDPTIGLEVALSVIAVLRQATVVGGSPEANAIATAIKAAQDVADVD